METDPYSSLVWFTHGGAVNWDNFKNELDQFLQVSFQHVPPFSTRSISTFKLHHHFVAIGFKVCS